MNDEQLGQKNYQLYVNGAFQDSSSKRTYPLVDGEGMILCQVAQANGEDIHQAAMSGRGALDKWGSTTPFLKSQMLYRLSEILEMRFVQFVQELVAGGVSTEEAAREVRLAIDLVIHYAGWADKFQALFSNTNPVSSPHLSVSTPEPVGVIGIVAPEESSFLGVLSAILPVIVGGNTCVVMASKMMPMSAISFADTLSLSKIPDGVVNILTGERAELLPTIISHLDIDGILLCSAELEERRFAREIGAESVKRVVLRDDAPLQQSPYHIMDFQEVKTLWHPVQI